MDLFLDVAERKMWRINHMYALGEWHELPGAEGHRFQVHANDNHFHIQIDRSGEQGWVSVQRADVPVLGSIYGQHPDLEPFVKPYVFTLEPSQAIFPIAELVEQVIGLGIHANQITPVFYGELADCHPSDDWPDMASDGNIYRAEIAEGSGLPARSHFDVMGASWAVQYSGREIRRVYLWMNAIERPDAVLEKIQCIQAGQFTTSYL